MQHGAGNENSSSEDTSSLLQFLAEDALVRMVRAFENLQNNPDPPNVVYSQINYLDQGGPVRRVVGLLQNLRNVDIIVNPTSRTLKLFAGGQISNTILQVAGPAIQVEIDRKYPRGITPGEIAVTGGHGLPYKFVYHCSLENISQRISHHEIREVVATCLQTAVTECKNMTPSIAFPAIGTGCMNFPPRIVKTIYCTILEFMVMNPGCVKVAYVIIHPENRMLIEYTKQINTKEELKRLTYPVTFPSSWSNTEQIQWILSAESDEYSHVAKKLHDTIGASVRIIKIVRIQNKRLYIAYKRFMNTLPAHKQTPEELWHGTKHSSVDGIVKYGFDWRLTERAAFGKGCYFAKPAYYSDDDTYSPPNHQGEKCMFLAYVLVGNKTEGKVNITEMTIPSNEQTAVNNLQNPAIFVTFNDDQVYPAFLVIYKKISVFDYCNVL